MVSQLEHVRVVLRQDGDGVALLPDHQPRLLLVGVAQVDSVKLKTKESLDFRGQLLVIMRSDAAGVRTSRS